MVVVPVSGRRGGRVDLKELCILSEDTEISLWKELNGILDTRGCLCIYVCIFVIYVK